MGDRPKSDDAGGLPPAQEPRAGAHPQDTVRGPRRRALDDVANAETVQVDTPLGAGIPSSPSPTVFAGREHAPVFAPGELAGGRYRVVRFVAAGGMGQVFEVHDEELDGRLALKTLHPSLAGHSAAARQFKLEIQLARRVTHPNVCRIFDLAYHRFADGTTTAFLTMELLEGETLRDRLRRGPLPAAEVRALAGQLARGLAAAHSAGVVHRDFKSDNVVLVVGERGVRPVITDFGVAVKDDPAAAGDRRGFVGTPDYIAPELVRGDEATDAADLYSFGVVLFEMLTGQLPFHGDGPLAIAMARLEHDAPDLRAVVPDLDPELAALVDACLMRDPSARRATVAPRLAALFAAPGAAVEAARGGSRWRRTAVVALITLGAVVPASVWLAVRAPGTGVLSEAFVRIELPRQRVKTRVHLRPFVEASQPGAALARSPLGYLTREAIRAELIAARGIRASRPNSSPLIEAGYGFLPESLDAPAARRMASATFAQFVVEGRVERVAAGLRCSARLLDGRTGALMVEVQGEGADLAALAAQIGRGLRTALAVDEVALVVPTGLLPRSAPAQRAYGEVLEDLAAGNVDVAQAALTGLLVGDDRFAAGLWLRAELAQARGDENVDVLFSDAVARAGELPEEEAVLLTAQAEIARGQSEAGVARCRELAARDPLDGRLQLDAVSCMSNAEHKQAMRTTLEALVAGPWTREQRLAFSLYLAMQALGERDFERSLTQSGVCLAEGRVVGDRSILALCLMVQAASLENLSRWADAARYAEEAATLGAEVGDVAVTLRAQEVLWRVLRRNGDLKELERNTRAAIERESATGGREVAPFELTLASVLSETGRLQAARELLEERLVPMFIAQSSTRYSAFAQAEASRMALLDADLVTAERYAASALTLYTAQANPRLQAYARMVLAEALAARGELAAARDKVGRALRYREEAKLARLASQSRVLLAELDLAGGDHGAAEAALAAILVDPEAGQTETDRAHALAMRCLALVALGRVAEAVPLAAEAFALAGLAQSQPLALEIARVRALVTGYAGDPQAARTELAALRKRAQAGGYRVEVLEIDLARARVELAAGRGAAARQLARGVAQKAKRLGLALLVRRAEAL